MHVIFLKSTNYTILSAITENYISEKLNNNNTKIVLKFSLFNKHITLIFLKKKKRSNHMMLLYLYQRN